MNGYGLLTIVQHGYGKGLPLVRGECPSCGVRALFLGAGGYVTCAGPTCANPSAASDVLDPNWQEDALPRTTASAEEHAHG